MAKRLAIITWDAGSVHLYADQVRQFFGDLVEIHTYSVQAGTAERVEPAEVYLVSTCAFTYRDITQLLPDNGPVVISEVHITRESLSRLLEVPHNTQALLVNINQPMATETMALLNQLGVTNIQFVPYYPGAPEPPRLAWAVTTGERRYVPSWVDHVMDLGPRLLSGNTFIELAFHLKCEHIIDQPAFQAYLSTLAERTYSIQRMFHRSIQVESLFDLFQQTLDAGVIGVDSDGTVFACNAKAEEILDLPVHQLLGHRAKDCLALLPIEECFSHQKAIHSRLIDINGSPVNVSLQPVLRGGRFMGGFCILQRFRDEENRQQKVRRQLLGKGHVTKYTFDSIVGQSPTMLAAKALAQKMAASSAAILISGESGTGKELFAQAIHAASPRRQEPFVAINCAAIPDSLLESQLFGYEAGSFTGAQKGGHIGFFEAARRGTLFLDEIEAMSPMLQVKLLRVLQEKEIVRLGGVDVVSVDVRVIAATNEDLPAVVRRGGFRKDLFYRLNVLPLQLPPLRQRGQDVLLLLEYIKEALGARFSLNPAALQALTLHPWDGNVRELRNCVEYLAYLDKPLIQLEDLPATIFSPAALEAGENASGIPSSQPAWGGDVAGQTIARLRQRTGSDFDCYAFVLSALGSGASAGRKSLSAQAAARGLPLTEQTARTVLLHLEEWGLVDIRRGRGGSRLTPLGRALSLRLEKEASSSPIF
ncbi:AAA family ATPase [Pseudoflavonifractor sp. 524-17]|uniref:sigma-54 interaction domain-containing protein n=1 Tax=Pseudoflavonifractor sp. 524-17 TaxID=2304577 RepID=UPI001379E780|nr:sigma 54-interacting transcriptional regulator [Pseudoflavonifractor sp. 524-17]NCE64981.1 AAA family ATPase [Pseudoflavonifractor sp. 524-17]